MISVFLLCWDIIPYTITHGISERKSLQLLTDKTKDKCTFVAQFILLSAFKKKHESPLMNHFYIPHANTKANHSHKFWGLIQKYSSRYIQTANMLVLQTETHFTFNCMLLFFPKAQPTHRKDPPAHTYPAHCIRNWSLWLSILYLCSTYISMNTGHCRKSLVTSH